MFVDFDVQLRVVGNVNDEAFYFGWQLIRLHLGESNTGGRPVQVCIVGPFNGSVRLLRLTTRETDPQQNNGITSARLWITSRRDTSSIHRALRFADPQHYGPFTSTPKMLPFQRRRNQGPRDCGKPTQGSSCSLEVERCANIT